jgi:peptide/nickel transport system substrate-binding protein
MNRTRNLIHVLVVFAMVFLAACGAAAPAQPAEPAAPAEAPAAEAPAAEAPAAGETALQGPVPYPEGQVLEGSREPVTFAVDQMIEHKAFDQYCEPEWVTALVDAGELPPVAERLPAEPFVWKSDMMSDGVGQYGGVWRGVWAVPLEGWNFAAGAIQGWFGIEAIVQEEPMATGPMFLTTDVSPLPQLAKSWEWSEDGLQLTMHLIEGIKWSDGDPFTTEDIMFLWEDNIHDPNVSTWTSADFWSIEGQPITLEAPDDYTLLWTFPVPRPDKFLYNITNLNFSPGPAHILKPFHPKYGGTDYQSYKDALPPNSLPVVTLGPWVPVEYTTDEFLVMRRNPYYWKVDSNGCQLPYLDEVQFTYSKTGATRTLNTIAGTADHSNVENIETMDETVRQSQDPNAPFRVEWGPETLGFNVEVNQAKFLGVANDRDRAVRDLLIDTRFRRALTQAIDRDGLARSLTNGPFFRAWPGGIFPGSQFYDVNSVVYYPYSPETSKALLAEIGLEDTDGDNVVNWTEGPMAGQNVEIALFTGEDNTAGQSLGPALVLFFQDIGIKINFRTLAGTAMTENERAGTWELRIGRPGQAWATPNIRCTNIAPVSDVSLGWHRAGTEAEEFQDFEQQLIDISNQFCLENDFDASYALMSEYNRIHTENVYSLGLVVGRYGLMLNKFFKNIPIGTPAFLYQWDFNNFLPEQVWLAPEDQTSLGQSEIYPQSVPFFTDCTYATDGTVCVVSAE